MTVAYFVPISRQAGNMRPRNEGSRSSSVLKYRMFLQIQCRPTRSHHPESQFERPAGGPRCRSGGGGHEPCSCAIYRVPYQGDKNGVGALSTLSPKVPRKCRCSLQNNYSSFQPSHPPPTHFLPSPAAGSFIFSKKNVVILQPSPEIPFLSWRQFS